MSNNLIVTIIIKKKFDSYNNGGVGIRTLVLFIKVRAGNANVIQGAWQNRDDLKKKPWPSHFSFIYSLKQRWYEQCFQCSGWICSSLCWWKLIGWETSTFQLWIVLTWSLTGLRVMIIFFFTIIQYLLILVIF